MVMDYSTWNKMYRNRNLPPGPTPIPLFGNFLQIKRGEIVKSLIEFGKKYGDVYTLYFGPKPVIILCGYWATKEALIDQTEDFSGRGAIPSFDQYFQGYGVIFTNGEEWKQLRRFSLTTLRNFGMGKRSIEERVKEEAQFLVAGIKSYQEKSFDPTTILVQSVSNVICSIVFGKRFEYANKDFQNLLSLFHSVFKEASSSWGQGTDVYPLLCVVLRDPEKFATPYKFNPNHFLDDNGCFKSNDGFMPFSTGKQLCLGEGLARMELFLFLTNILQNFKLHSETHLTDDDIAPKMNG